MTLLGLFDWQPRTRIVFGEGSLSRLGELARECGGVRALVVTDKGVAAAGYAERAAQSLREAGFACAVFDAVRENATTVDVDACVAAAHDLQTELFVGVGGGSSLDTARGANFLYTNGGRMQDYWGVGKASKPMLPMIAVPTTAGTGSETQSFALIADATTHQKMACGDPKAAARVALLDPELTLSLPRSVTAHAGMDALVHAVETAVTKRRNPVSLLFSREAFRLLAHNLGRVLEAPDDLEARGAMLLGAAYAGLAIENSMLGIAHSLANPLTAHFNVVHGQAVGMMLPHVVGFNAQDAETALLYRDLLAHAGLCTSNAAPMDAVETLLVRLYEALETAEMPDALAPFGVTDEAIPTLAEEATRQWTAGFNPRAVTADDLAALYRDALAAT